ncbi:hypothetical protein SARC_00936 [Sphaeroforma arctica JP610]|uniref:Uncharacterized protein n=1 Tax=Sphaeroforma arctica JP610 TaxID=667725 RepID=A0A0L0GDE8_9EUKA|nr:hypothetical protein SARC_00936 [Sphaeroforma arctica JP610]KNC86934.1 hypothetical protein SARC_00936 [Sphaeroforma arctica JP610]|eukprot:XP_014160836.1 hypothetical protein SARC_00936 [Sphaeroforma arctica JP610]
MAHVCSTSGYKGDLGSKIYGSADVVADPLTAKQKVIIGLNGLTDEDRDTAANEHFKGYLQWTDVIRSKLVDHVSENLSSYPKLRIKYKQWENRPEMLREMLDGASSKCIKYKKDEQGDNIEESAYGQMDKKMFYKQKDGNDKAPRLTTEFDKEVYENMRGIRLNLPHYNIEGEKMDLETTELHRNDVVSVEVQITSSMYETFFGLKNNLRSVTVLHKFQRKGNNSTFKKQKSPFGNLSAI